MLHHAINYISCFAFSTTVQTNHKRSHQPCSDVEGLLDGSRTYLTEVPLSNFWGIELAQCASGNAVQYYELFCKVMDAILNSMDVTTSSTDTSNNAATAMSRDSVDIFLEKRRAQQEARTEEQQASQVADGRLNDVNGPSEEYR